jgi:hypothetical protein
MKLSELTETVKRLQQEYGDLELKTWSNGVYKPATLHLASDSETGHFIAIMSQPRLVWELLEDSDGTFRSRPEALGLFVRTEALAKEFTAMAPMFRARRLVFETPAMTEVLAVDDATLRVGFYKQRNNIEELKKQREIGA